MKITTIIIAAGVGYLGYQACKRGYSIPGLGAPSPARRPMLHQMFSNWGQLLQQWQAITAQIAATRSGGGARATLQRQRVDVQNQMKQTPEYKAAFAACKNRADIMNDGQPGGIYQPKVDPSNLRCDVFAYPSSFEGGAE